MRLHENLAAALRRLPLATLALTATAVAASSAAAAGFFELTPAALAAGESWRLLTGHFTHFGAEHLLWDAAAFAFLGTLCERDSRPRFLAALALAALAIPAAILLVHPALPSYRGLSGLDSALFALLTATIVRERAAEGGWGWVAVTCAVFALFLGKLVFELATGTAFFLQDDSAFVPVPLAHLVGAAAGLVAGCWTTGQGRVRVGEPEAIS
ncbi:MAG: rhombosortase [Planctomycetes bacterium]|nr:rhombosortase [Planctomycetota bacterium]